MADSGTDAPRFDPLAGYAFFLQAWRVATCDLPLAVAASMDSFTSEVGRIGNNYAERMVACDDPASALAEQAHAAGDLASAAAREASAFARDMDVLVEPLNASAREGTT